MLISEECLFSKSRTATKEIHKEELFSNYNELYYAKILRLKNLFEEFDIKIICYLRRQDLFVESEYNQACKTFMVKDTVSFVDRKSKDFNALFDKSLVDSEKSVEFISRYKFCFIDTHYYDILNAWADVFGKDNIIVKPFEKVQIKTGLVKDFFINVLSIDEERLTNLVDQRENDRINRDLLEYHIKLEKPPKHYNMYDIISLSNKFEESNLYEGDFNSFFTVSERYRLLDYHKKGNEKIAREYLQREDGLLFYEEMNMLEEKSYPGLSREKTSFFDRELRRIQKRTVPFMIKKRFDELKSYEENSIAIENYNWIEKIKVYLISVKNLFKLIVYEIVKTLTLLIKNKEKEEKRDKNP